MADPIGTYVERTDDYSPSVSGFAVESAKAQMVLDIDSPRNTAEMILDLLGDCTPGTDRKLKRRMPQPHPEYPWLYASNIVSINGLGVPTVKTRKPAISYNPLARLDRYAEYPRYRVTVEFTPRPYAVLDDEYIASSDLKWTMESGGDEVTARIADEWKRFTDWDYLPASEQIYATSGNMKFRLRNDPTLTSPEPHMKPFAGFPNMILPKAMVSFKWFQVPFDYVTHPESWISKGRGKINQLKFLHWEPGELLYVDQRIRRYTPPAPRRVTFAGLFDNEKLCDIEFIFEETKRTQAEPSEVTISNKNWVRGGHNLLPWIQRKGFYYATSVGVDPDTDNTKWVPNYLSFPFQLLFRNPE